MSRRDVYVLPLYVGVIALATTLPDPWMIAMQAAVGGAAFGARLYRFAASRSSAA